MDLDGRGDFEENWESELENIIFPAFLRVSKREARMLVRRGLRSGSDWVSEIGFVKNW
jgi:hypothetical protein